MRQERPDHTLQATSLVNEAYLRLIDVKSRRMAESRALPRSGGADDATDPGLHSAGSARNVAAVRSRQSR
jgi:hypothetical protein